jgi:hypothetical protein
MTYTVIFPVFVPALKKIIEKHALGWQAVLPCFTVSEWLRMTFIFSNNVCILCLSCNVKKSQKQLPNCWKRAETSIVLIIVYRHHGFCAITLYYVTDPSQTQGSLAQNNASDWFGNILLPFLIIDP